MCPASELLSEACFRKCNFLTFARVLVSCVTCADKLALPSENHPVAFARFDGQERHKLRYANTSRDFEFAATVVKRGGGQGWMKWPFPK